MRTALGTQQQQEDQAQLTDFRCQTFEWFAGPCGVREGLAARWDQRGRLMRWRVVDRHAAPRDRTTRGGLVRMSRNGGSEDLLGLAPDDQPVSMPR